MKVKEEEKRKEKEDNGDGDEKEEVAANIKEGKDYEENYGGNKV